MLGSLLDEQKIKLNSNKWIYSPAHFLLLLVLVIEQWKRALSSRFPIDGVFIRSGCFFFALLSGVLFPSFLPSPSPRLSLYAAPLFSTWCVQTNSIEECFSKYSLTQQHTNGIPTVQTNWKYLWRLMINKSRKAELKRTHLTKVAMLKATNCLATIFTIWCELFKFIAMTFKFAQMYGTATCSFFSPPCRNVSVCVYACNVRYSNGISFPAGKNGSAFSDGSIKSINFYWTFVFQVCPVQCAGKSRNRSFTLLLCSAYKTSAKIPWIVNEMRGKIRRK